MTTAASVYPISILAGQTTIENPAQTGTPTYVFYQPSGVAVAEGNCLPRHMWYLSGGGIFLRRPAATNMSLIYGTSADPTFVVPEGTLGVIVQNLHAASIYIRKGQPNGYGYTIGIPGDSNIEGVEGIEIAGGASFILQAGQLAAGDEWHILGSTSGQTALVNFS